MNYSDAINYLNGFVNFERTPFNQAARANISLHRIFELAEKLGNPQKKFSTIHVAGTKGKGSTCAFAASILQTSGLKTGLYTSPDLQGVRERIRVNGEQIAESDFARILSGCVDAIESMRNPPLGERRPTYFEILTHIGFTHFAEQEVEVAVIEVGLGGRLDATNIIQPGVCGISNISFDHMAILGSTLPEIAREKAGIIKPKVPVICAPQEAGAMAAIQSIAIERDAELLRLGAEIQFAPVPVESPMAWPFPRAHAVMPDYTKFSASLGLRGSFQVENWALAVALADFWNLRVRGTHLSQSCVAEGSRNVKWPGRLDEIKLGTADSRIFLDGAHNDHSVRRVLEEIRANLPDGQPLVVVFGCAKDKDAAAMLRTFLEVKISGIVFTHSNNPRAMPPEELGAIWLEIAKQTAPAVPDCMTALEIAAQNAGPSGTVVVMGSLYLVGAIMDRLHPRDKTSAR